MLRKFGWVIVLFIATTNIAHGQAAHGDAWYFLKDHICFAPGDPRLNMDEFGIYNTRLVKTPADVAVLIRKAGMDERTDPDSTDNVNVVIFYVLSKGKGTARILMVNGLSLCRKMASNGQEDEIRWYSVQGGECKPMPDTPEDVLGQARTDGAVIQPAPNNTKGAIEGYHILYKGKEIDFVFIKGLKGCRLMVQVAKANHQNIP